MEAENGMEIDFIVKVFYTKIKFPKDLEPCIGVVCACVHVLNRIFSTSNTLFIKLLIKSSNLKVFEMELC